MNSSSFRQSLALIGLGLAAGAAHATSTVEASLSDFAVSAHGSFTWLHTPSSGPYDNFLVADSADQIGWTDDGTLLSPLFSTHQHTQHHAPAAFAAQSGATVGSLTTAAAQSTANSLWARVSANADGGHAGASVRWSDHFVLGSGASVTFSWRQSMSALNPGGDVLPARYLLDPNASTDGVATSVMVFAGNQDLNTSRLGTSGIGAQDIGFAFSELGELRTLTVTNTTAIDYTGRFEAHVSAELIDRPAVTTVPEAPPWALAAAGAVAAALLTRRRAR